MSKLSWLTGMVHVLPEIHIPVPPRSDVEIALDFISLQTAVDAARVLGTPDPRRLGKLFLLFRGTELVMHIPQLLPARQTVVSLAQFVDLFALTPLPPARRILAQHLACQGAIACSVLHVDVEVGAAHGNDDVEVDLEVVRHALFDGEGLGCVPRVPSRDLGPGEVNAG
jgi:hypothetical protein